MLDTSNVGFGRVEKILEAFEAYTHPMSMIQCAVESTDLTQYVRYLECFNFRLINYKTES